MSPSHIDCAVIQRRGGLKTIKLSYLLTGLPRDTILMPPQQQVIIWPYLMNQHLNCNNQPLMCNITSSDQAMWL